MGRELDIGALPSGLAPDTQRFFTQIQRLLRVGILNGALTVAGPNTLSSGATLADGTVLPGTVPPDYRTQPPIPTGLSASSSTAGVMVITDPPRFSMGHGYLRTRVYGAKVTLALPSPTFSDAAMVHDFSGEVGSFGSDPDTDWRLWATWVTADGVESLPAGGAGGVSTTIDLIDDAKIGSLSATKIRAGNISVGEYIRSSTYVSGVSGWTIEGGGFAEFANVVVRGTIYATAGEIGGNTITAASVSSPGYTAGLNGWRLTPDGRVRAYYNAGANHFDIGATGVQPVLKIGSVLSVLGNGSATYGGTLAAASGTFGTITSGRMQNAGNTNFINLDATGSQVFIQSGSGDVRITADGDAFFRKVAASATYTLPAAVDIVQDDGAGGWLYLSGETMVDTGLNVPYFTNGERAMSGRVTGWSGTIYFTVGVPALTYVAAPVFSAVVLFAHPRGLTGLSTENPFGDTNSRVYLRIWYAALAIPPNDSRVERVTIDSIDWTLDYIA